MIALYKRNLIISGIIFIILTISCSVSAVTENTNDLDTKPRLNSTIFNENEVISIQHFFKHSNVIAYRQGALSDYKSYGVTFVSWGGRPENNARSIQNYCTRIHEAQNIGIKIGAKIGTRTDFAGFIDYLPDHFKEHCCVKVDGSPLIVPNMDKVTYKEYPAYWFCTNSPVFRQYLKNEITNAISCNPFGIMMDDQLGTAASVIRGGCYCKYCVKKFREYLQMHYSTSELVSMGISDIEHFDLRDFHKGYSHIPPNKRPLYKEILSFQLECSREMFREIMSFALDLSGKRILVSGNINPIYATNERLILDVDYFACECPLGAKTGMLGNGNSLFLFKMATAIKRPAAIMGTGEDHAFISDNNLPGMVRCWVAEAYAFGHYFMAPYYLWAYSTEKGSYSYEPRTIGELAPMYQFITRHWDLFDNYEDFGKVGLIHSFESFRNGSNKTETIVKQLASANVPFEIVPLSNKIHKMYLTKELLSRYDILIVPPDAILSQENALFIKQYIKSGRKVIDNSADIDKNHKIEVLGAEQVMSSLRSIHNDVNRPIILHLLNRDYNVLSDACDIKTNFTLRIPKTILGARKILMAKYVRPYSWEPKTPGEPLQALTEKLDVNLPLRYSTEYIEVIVPELDVWGIIILFSDNIPQSQ